MLTAALGLRERGHQVRLVCAEGSQLGLRAREAGLPVDEVVFHGDLDPGLSFRYWQICRRHQIELLCLNMDKVLRVAGPPAKLAGATVVPRRGSDPPVGSKASHKFAYLKIAEGVIANSMATRSTMLTSATWLPEEKIRVIYNGIATEKYKPDTGLRAEVRTELGLNTQTRVLGMVGELTTRKNHQIILEQMPALLKHEPQLQLIIAGQGPQMPVLAQQVEQMGISDSVQLLGFRNDVPRLLQAMDIFVHPALREGFGYVVVEAMASGLPVIVTNTSNLPEIVTEGQTGLLCAPADGAQWRQQILKLLADQTLAQDLARSGYQQAQGRFSFTRMLDELEDYFRVTRRRSR